MEYLQKCLNLSKRTIEDLLLHNIVKFIQTLIAPSLWMLLLNILVQHPITIPTLHFLHRQCDVAISPTYFVGLGPNSWKSDCLRLGL